MKLADLWNDNDGKRSIVFEFHGDQVEFWTDEYKRGKAEANVIQLKRALNELKDKMFFLMRNKEIEKRGQTCKQYSTEMASRVEERDLTEYLSRLGFSSKEMAMGLSWPCVHCMRRRHPALA